MLPPLAGLFSPFRTQIQLSSPGFSHSLPARSSCLRPCPVFPVAGGIRPQVWAEAPDPSQGSPRCPSRVSSGPWELAASGRDNLVARNIAAIPLLPSSVHLGNISLNTHLTARPREMDASSASEGSVPVTLKCHHDTPRALRSPRGARGSAGSVRRALWGQSPSQPPQAARRSLELFRGI